MGMTNEFAIKVLTELRGYGDKFANIGYDRKGALELAIKTLEQQPCEDCISRKEAVRHGRLIYDDDGKSYVAVRVDEIIDLPSVTQTLDGEHTFGETYDMGYEEGYDIGYNCGYTDAMIDIAEGSESK